MLRLERAAENIQGLLPEMMHDAGFEQVEETARFTIFFGTLALIRARKS
jgi:ubiquinone/menaquinone biosynthesis C-methylase UbiE